MDVQTMAEKIKAAVMAAPPEHNKGKEKITQFQIIYDCFSTVPKTMRQVEAETGVRAPNICWTVFKMKRNGTIQKMSVGRCPISHRKAAFYTTNKDLMREKQLSFFDYLWKGKRL